MLVDAMHIYIPDEATGDRNSDFICNCLNCPKAVRVHSPHLSDTALVYRRCISLMREASCDLQPSFTTLAPHPKRFFCVVDLLWYQCCCFLVEAKPPSH
jgi:hypothetical protein